MKVWLYHRESTRIGAEQKERHFQELREYAQQHGHEVVGQSFDLAPWTDIDRSGLVEAVKAIRNRVAEAIMVIGPSVLARDATTMLAITMSTELQCPFIFLSGCSDALMGMAKVMADDH